MVCQVIQVRPPLPNPRRHPTWLCQLYPGVGLLEADDAPMTQLCRQSSSWRLGKVMMTPDLGG